MSSRITKEEIDTIVHQQNLLVRNLQITLGYYKVGRKLRRFLGSSNVNWFGFGTYASKTAGQTIRHELLPGPLKSAMIRAAGYDNTYVYLQDVLAEPEAQNPDSLLAEVLSQVSLLVSKGNLMIFEELAWPFVDMTNRFSRRWRPDMGQFQAFLDEHLRPGPLAEGGQEWLRESFTCFYQARFTTDSKKKAELIYMGNLLLGYHEQTRLQPVIEQALAVPFDIFTDGIIPESDNRLGGMRRKMARRATGFSRQMVLRAVTRMMMTYSLPTRRLKLGKDLVAPTGLINFPRELMQIENPRCQELVLQFDSGLNTLSGSAAGNWGNLMDRMNFLVDFFRSYQHYKPLFRKPFLPSQIPVIEAGQFPGGPL
ncbi:MAG TPA: hypothetical protein ENJ93_04725 [Chloroflexi bacterium]|nr:hypothetical protein [Chloroflexota bacterium]